MMNGIVLFFRFILKHKWKISLTLTMTIWFLVFLFPFNDLNDLVSMQISKLTNNKVFVQFDRMSLNPFTTELALEKVFIETPQISTLTTDELSFSPSVSALIAKKAGGTLSAHGFLKGDLEIHISPAPQSTESKVEKSKINVTASNLNLKDLRELVGLSLPIKGQLNLASQSLVDLAFTEQPDGDLAITINKFELPPSALALQDMGRVNLPEIKLGLIELKGKLNTGKFLIESGKIGTSKDDLYGDVKGDIGITFQNYAGQIVPVVDSYSLSLSLKANAAFKERAKFFLSFLDGYKSESVGGTEYKFKVHASAVGMPPQFSPLR